MVLAVADYRTSLDTIGRVKDLVYIRTNTNSTEWSTRIDQLIRECYRDVESRFDFTFLHKTGSLTLATSTEYYSLPGDFHQFVPRGNVRTDTDKVEIIPTRFANMDTLFGSSTATGATLSHYHVFVQPRYVEAELAANSVITILSDDGSEAAYTVYLEGLDTSSLFKTETVASSGTSTANGSVTFLAGSFFKATKAADTTGTITVRDASSNTLLRLLPRVRALEFRRMQVKPTPTSDLNGETLTFGYIAKIPDPVSDNDVCFFRDSKILSHYIQHNILFSQTDPRYVEEREAYESAIEELIANDQRYTVEDKVSEFEN